MYPLPLMILISRYIEHYSKWLPDYHHYMCDVKVALVQIIGTGGPDVLQNIPEDRLMLKIDTTRGLLKVFQVIAAGNLFAKITTFFSSFSPKAFGLSHNTADLKTS